MHRRHARADAEAPRTTLRSPLLIAAMALRSARALPLAALLLLPIANARDHQCLDRSARGLAAFLGRDVDRLLRIRRACDQTRLRRMNGLPRSRRSPVVALVRLLLSAPAHRRRRRVPARPVSRSAAYPHIPTGARLFAPDKFGGYLIYRSNGALKVFFDGRSDLYGAEFLKQYARMVQVRPGWRILGILRFHARPAARRCALCCRPWNRSAGARFTGIKPRLCLYLAELNRTPYVLQQNIGRI